MGEFDAVDFLWPLELLRGGHRSSCFDLPTFLYNTIQICVTFHFSVVIVSVIVLIVSIIWTCMILAFKCAGPRKVGFLAGRLAEPDPTRKISPRTSAEFLSVIQEEDEAVDVDEGESLLSADLVASTPMVITDVMEEEARRVELETKFARKVTAVRAAFLLSGVGVIITQGLYYGKGVNSLNNAFDEVLSASSVSVFRCFVIVVA